MNLYSSRYQQFVAHNHQSSIAAPANHTTKSANQSSLDNPETIQKYRNLMSLARSSEPVTIEEGSFAHSSASSASSILHRIRTMLSIRLAAAARVSRSAGKTATRGRSSVARATSRRSAAVGGTSVARSRVPALFYTTERVLELRSGKGRAEQPPTVYSPERETENCGVGLVASLKSVPSRKIVEDADEMLVRMAHRGGCGCDPASGDGAGELTAALQKDAR